MASVRVNISAAAAIRRPGRLATARRKEFLVVVLKFLAFGIFVSLMLGSGRRSPSRSLVMGVLSWPVVSGAGLSPFTGAIRRFLACGCGGTTTGQLYVLYLLFIISLTLYKQSALMPSPADLCDWVGVQHLGDVSGSRLSLCMKQVAVSARQGCGAHLEFQPSTVGRVCPPAWLSPVAESGLRSSGPSGPLPAGLLSDIRRARSLLSA